MKNLWSRNELIVAFNLYCKIGFTKIKYSHPDIISLAKLINRSPSAVAFKLVNFARLDPELKRRGVKGMGHGSKSEEPIWDEFDNNWDDLAYESEKILANLKGKSIEEVSGIQTNDLPPEGKERETIVKIRVNQKFFRYAILSSYQNTCCVTGLKIPDLLIASHIVPWSKNLKCAVNPHNGLCLNALHDRAFDKGLFTISEDYRILLSTKIAESKNDDVLQNYFISYNKMEIKMPHRFLPEKEFLEFHRDTIFIP